VASTPTRVARPRRRRTLEVGGTDEGFGQRREGDAEAGAPILGLDGVPLRRPNPLVFCGSLDPKDVVASHDGPGDPCVSLGSEDHMALGGTGREEAWSLDLRAREVLAAT
jgi:hypothetical protein